MAVIDFLRIIALDLKSKSNHPVFIMGYPDSRSAVIEIAATSKDLIPGRAQTIAGLLLQKLEVPANKVSIGIGKCRNSTILFVK